MIKYFSMMLSVFILLSSCKLLSHDKSQIKSDSSDNLETELELDNQDIDLPGPVENLLSLLVGTPVFGDGNSIRRELKYDPRHGLDPIKQAISSRPAEMGDVLNFEDAGSTTINKGTIEGAGVVEQRFQGVCLNGKVFLLKGVNPANKDDQFESTETSYVLQNVGQMPSSYRQDIKGCRNRFLELVNIKFREQAMANADLEVIENLNFAFSFIPGYAGAENISNGETVLGVCEVVADIASLGAATKFKAGWRTLLMSKRMFRSAQSGFRMATIGANSVRLGQIIHKSVKDGVSVSDIPTVVLLVAETGFVLTKMKVRRTKLLAAQKMISTVADAATEALPIKNALKKIANRVKTVEADSLTKLFTGKFAGDVSQSELTRIRNVANSGGSLTIDDIHKMITHTSLTKPDTAVNVTSNSTIAKIIDGDGRYWGYLGSEGLPKGLYAAPKPIAWSSMDLALTQGSNVSRDTMLVFTGSAVNEFQRVQVEKGFFGRTNAFIAKFTKTTMKPNNPEFVTPTGDVRFLDFEVFHDGIKTLVVVKKVEILDELHNLKRGTPEYNALIRVKVVPFCTGVLMDAAVATSAGMTIVAGALAGAESIEWLVSPEEK